MKQHNGLLDNKKKTLFYVPSCQIIGVGRSTLLPRPRPLCRVLRGVRDRVLLLGACIVASASRPSSTFNRRIFIKKVILKESKDKKVNVSAS